MPSTSASDIRELLAGKAFCIVNLGCKVNKVEADTLGAALMASGAAPTTQEDAQVIIVNTCTVTGEADKKARKAVRHALKANDHARVVVTGCAVAIDAQSFAQIDERIAVIDRMRLSEAFSAAHDDLPMRMGGSFRTRINVKVQDGCDHACTYCIVHIARGPARSTPYDQVLGDVKRYLEMGAKEIVLTGIDLASYRDGARKLGDLVEAILDAADAAHSGSGLPARVRASSIEPDTLDDRIIDLLATSDGRLCRHLHLPLQSGSSKVLREMGRNYDAVCFSELVAELYERVPALALTTDVIVGFPGETEEEFGETLQLARACRFSKMHVFPYSMREGTPAARRVDQTDPHVKARRARDLRKLSDDLRSADFARRVGSWEAVLVEGERALTESYHEVTAPLGSIPGDLVRMELTRPL